MIVLRHVLLLLGGLVRRVLRRVERIDVLRHPPETRGHTEFSSVKIRRTFEERKRERERRSPSRSCSRTATTQVSHGGNLNACYTCYCTSRKRRTANSCCVSRGASDVATGGDVGDASRASAPLVVRASSILIAVRAFRVSSTTTSEDSIGVVPRDRSSCALRLRVVSPLETVVFRLNVPRAEIDNFDSLIIHGVWLDGHGLNVLSLDQFRLGTMSKNQLGTTLLSWGNGWARSSRRLTHSSSRPLKSIWRVGRDTRADAVWMFAKRNACRRFLRG